MSVGRVWSEKQQYRVVLCGHKAVEAGAVCLILMVQGNLLELTLAHLAIASKTGVLAIVPALWLTFTRHAHVFLNKWAAGAVLGICTFVADALMHGSHYPGAYMEAALTGVGAFVFSVVVAYTPLGKRIDRLAEAFLRHHPAAK
jgi:hypothetical protein